MKFETNILRDTYVDDGSLDGQEVVEITIEVDDDIINPIVDYLDTIGQFDRLKEVIINGCRTVEQVKEFIEDFPE